MEKFKHCGHVINLTIYCINTDPLSLQHTYAKWKYGINIFPPNKGVKLYVFQRDKWGNGVKDLANFQVIIYRDDDTLPSPYGDIWFQAADGFGKGTQLITFTTTASGIFSLYIEDASGNQISGCPYNFSVLASKTQLYLLFFFIFSSFLGTLYSHYFYYCEKIYEMLLYVAY
jgi:hypothetical protein